MAVDLKSSIKAAKFKTDWVTILAIVILITIILCELVVVIWLPVHLRSSLRWEKEVAYQEVLGQLDTLRSNLQRCQKKQLGNKGEINLVQTCFNQLAHYLRVGDYDLNRNDIRKIKTVLDGFERAYLEIYKNKTFNSPKQLDLSGFLADLRGKCRKAESETH